MMPTSPLPTTPRVSKQRLARRAAELAEFYRHPVDCPCELCHRLWGPYRQGVPRQEVA